MVGHRAVFSKISNIAIVAALAATLVSCTGGPEPSDGVLEVSPQASRLDEAVHIKVTGLSSGQQIALTATGTGLDGQTWSSRATFRAGDNGVVDLDRDAPVSGDYSGVDGMGLIAAMVPTSSAPAAAEGPAASLQVPQASPVTVAVTDGPTVQLSRVAVADGVTSQQLTVTEHGVAGLLLTPAAATGTGVLLIGGPDDRVSTTAMALMLAANGYPALAVEYFNAPDLPAELRNVPIEYFATAASKLPGPVRVVGSSRGSEAALLLSALYPSLVAGTVIAAPADKINLGFPNGGYAWVFGNAPRMDIPYSAIVGPVLAIAGTEDAVWPSAENVTRLSEQLGDRLESLVIEGAGHDVLGAPYVSSKPDSVHPVTGEPFYVGGTRQANEQACREAWAALLEFLAPSS